MTVYYNEFNLEAAAWLEELIKKGHIAYGHVDTRSIEDVRPDELRGYAQCHFFAGIGVWSYALRRAGWDDERPIWSGSCPCQPFSAAGKGAAFDDERHLWPAFHHLIKVGRPAILVGEQVASAAVDAWIDLVHADLEAVGYAFGSIPFPSAGVGAPHIRDRNYWVGQADPDNAGLERRHRVPERSVELVVGPRGLAGGLADAGRSSDRTQEQAADNGQSQADRSTDQPGGRGVPLGGVGDDNGNGRGSIAIAGIHDAEYHAEPRGGAERLADDSRDGRREQRQDASGRDQRSGAQELEQRFGGSGIRGTTTERTGPTNGFWRDADWLGCRDGKWRPVEPGAFPLVDGAAARVVSSSDSGVPINAASGEARVMRLRGYGNAINAEAAKAFISVVMETLDGS